MNWSRAKNISIICLLALNVLLSGLIYYTSKKYTLTSEQERNVYSFLARGSVSLTGNIVKNYAPMPALITETEPLDADAVCGWFFPKADGVETSYDDTSTVFTLGAAVLTVDGGTLSYYDADCDVEQGTTLAAAEKLCLDFLALGGDSFSGFTLDRSYEQDGIYTLEYREKYKSTVVYSDAASFTVNAAGIAEADISLGEISSEGNSREILSPDAAIYLLVQSLNYYFGNEPVTVEKMDIVYVGDDNGSAGGTAEPNYRFYISGAEQPVLVNAYTGVVDAGL